MRIPTQAQGLCRSCATRSLRWVCALQPRQKLSLHSLDSTPTCRLVVIACRRVGPRAEHWRQLAACIAAASASQQPEQQGPPLRVAVIGGGFAGLAASYHLLAAAAGSGRAMQLTLYDAVGLGAGGSGAAAGLLHPYTPRGKVRRAGSACITSAWG